MIERNIVMALASAAAWGGGDFSGGMGVKAAGGGLRGALRVVVLSHLTSFSMLMVTALALGMAPPRGTVLGWGLAAGVAGGVSLTAFYVALARGAMGAPAAMSGLLAAAVPALVALASEGSPGGLKLAGFAVAGGAIWLIAAGPGPEEGRPDRGAMGLAIGGGAGFGVYFAALKMANAAGPVWAMGAARMGSLAACGAMLLGLRSRTRGEVEAARGGTIRWVVLTALLDTAGNMLFIAATRAGRLDVAAVLASLYPATTILLAAWTLKERPTRRQAMGMGAAAVAVAMITL